MKAHSDCSIVTDLLPLSIDRLTSDESEAFVQRHLKTCAACRQYKEKLCTEKAQQENGEQQTDNRMRRFLKRHRYEMLGLFLGIFILPLTVLCLLILPRFTESRTDKESYPISEHFEQVSDYGKQNYQGISQLRLFPDASSCSGQITEFYYDCKGQKLYQSYQIFLNCSYSPGDYETEKQRLLQTSDAKTGRTPIYSEAEANLPCVYAMLYDEGYEYALLSDADHTIRYIYLQGIDRRELVFDTGHLPKDYGQTGYSFETEREPYRIYPYDWE